MQIGGIENYSQNSRKANQNKQNPCFGAIITRLNIEKNLPKDIFTRLAKEEKIE